MNNQTIKPFLKYPGGKFRQVEKIKKLLPQGNRLVEPFIGAGSVFLNTNYSEYLLGDVNADLINTFKVLVGYQEEFISRCKQYFVSASNNVEVYNYYRQVFNSINLTTANLEKRLNKGCLFIYLNRHGFRGMVRYNAKGQFNVPYGYYPNAKVYFPENELLAFINKVNQAALVEFRVADFKSTLTRVRAGDVLYCDPPYLPLSNTSNFSKYYIGSFSLQDQKNLLQLCKKLRADKNITTIISNHATAKATALYADLITTEKLFVKRSVCGNSRSVAPELMVSV